MAWPDPKVVISNTPPPIVQCRDETEVAACNEVLRIIRRGHEPILFVARMPNGAHDVYARSRAFPTLQRAQDVCQEIKVKLLDNLVRKRVPLA